MFSSLNSSMFSSWLYRRFYCSNNKECQNTFGSANETALNKTADHCVYLQINVLYLLNQWIHDWASALGKSGGDAYPHYNWGRRQRDESQNRNLDRNSKHVLILFVFQNGYARCSLWHWCFGVDGSIVVIHCLLKNKGIQSRHKNVSHWGWNRNLQHRHIHTRFQLYLIHWYRVKLLCSMKIRVGETIDIVSHATR